ncbi:MAG: hypothetical protein ACK6A4_07630, partial [Alphaproteobacteria bacterium]
MYYTLDWREIAGSDQSTAFRCRLGLFLRQVSQMFHVPIFLPIPRCALIPVGTCCPSRAKFSSFVNLYT